MYVRLAFAVAAHLEPDILLVDEVLAVGDATFQNKCLGKMEDVAQRSGRTVLFVSHNMSAVQTLCGRIVHLSQGRVRGVGPADEQIRAYLADMQQVHSGCELMNQKLGPDLELRRLQLSPNPVVTGQDLEYTLEIVASRATTLVEFQLLLHSVYGARVAMIDLRGPGGAGHLLQAGQVIRFRGRIRHLPLVEGDYRAGVFYHSTGHYGDLLDLVTLTVDGAPAVDGRVPYKPVHRGVLNLDAPFEVETGPA
jgi:energy-coupling factor transporter ATP-binding protein EcfA2